MEYFMAQIIAAFLGTIVFSLLFNIPSRYFLYCGVTGAVGMLGYLLFLFTGSNVVAVFFATGIVAFLSKCFAIGKRCPATIFLIPGIFPLVPGAGIYYVAYNVIIDNLELAAQQGINTLKISGAIVLGITLISNIQHIPGRKEKR